MYKILAFAASFFSLPMFTGGQSLRGQVYDEDTYQAVPYALISNTQRSIGITADSTGNFFIKNIGDFDSLRVSRVGYRSTTVKVVRDTLKIALRESIEELAPVFLRGRKSATVQSLGVTSRRSHGRVTGVKGGNYEFALLIENPGGQEGLMESVGYYLENEGNHNARFGVKVYQNDRGKPGAVLTQQLIVVHGYKVKWNWFNLSAYRVVIPAEGCFVAMQWLDIETDIVNQADGQSLGMTREFKESRFFSRTNGGEWHLGEKVFSIPSGNFFGQTEHYNPMIAVKAKF